MPLQLEWTKKLQTSTDRVKCVDIHPNETWVLTALFSGQLVIYDYATQSQIKSIEASTLPIRCCQFIPRMNWVVCGADDMKIRVYNYITLEKVIAFDAHADYIRSVHVHSTWPLLVTSGDDMSVKLWNWELGWQKVQTFDNHNHYVMMVRWSPRDQLLFASASLDCSIKVWSIMAPGSSGTSAISSSADAIQTTVPNFTLTGHERGVNSIEYSQNGDKPYLLSSSDDCTIRVWDYQTRQCLQILRGHTKNASHAIFHPYLNLIVSGSEDGTIRVHSASTYRLEAVKDLDHGRIWFIGSSKNSNDMAFGTDAGCTVVSIGSERPVVSMHGGKLLFVKGTEVYSANLKLIDEASLADGEKLPLSIKEAGSAAVISQSISHHPNGRLVAICGDGEYTVLTSQALRNKAYGLGLELVWSPEGLFAVREESERIRILLDFKEIQMFKPPFDVLEIHGGTLLGVRGDDCICFYDWFTSRYIHRIDLSGITNVCWSDTHTDPSSGLGTTTGGGSSTAVGTTTGLSGASKLLCISTRDHIYIYRYDSDIVTAAITGNVPESDEGIPAAFERIGEIHERMESACWIYDTLIFLTSNLRLQSWVFGHVEVIAFAPKLAYLIGFVPETSRVYLADRDMNVYSYKILLPYLLFQSFVVNNDLDTALMHLNSLPLSYAEKAAVFLSGRGFKDVALKLTKDRNYKFQLTIEMNLIPDAYQILQDQERRLSTDHQQSLANSDIVSDVDSALKLLKVSWKKLGDAALNLGYFQIATESYTKAEDIKSLLLISVCIGDDKLLQKVSKDADAAKLKNISFMSSYLLHDIENCLNILTTENRAAEAAIMARTFLPSKLQLYGNRWKEEIATVNAHHASQIVLPGDEDAQTDGFDYFQDACLVEAIIKEVERERSFLPIDYLNAKDLQEYDLTDELREMGAIELKSALTSAPGAEDNNHLDDDEDDEDDHNVERSSLNNHHTGNTNNVNSSQNVDNKLVDLDVTSFSSAGVLGDHNDNIDHHRGLPIIQNDIHLDDSNSRSVEDASLLASAMDEEESNNNSIDDFL